MSRSRVDSCCVLQIADVDAVCKNELRSNGAAPSSSSSLTCGASCLPTRPTLSSASFSARLATTSSALNASTASCAASSVHLLLLPGSSFADPLLAADGVSIPSSYTSFLAPITSSKLHADVTGVVAGGDAKPAEQPYVVMFSATHTLSAAGGRLGSEKIQECWAFDHPRPDVVVDAAGAPSSSFSARHC